MSRLPRRIVAAALRLEENCHPGLVVVGVRHFDVLMIAQLHALGYGAGKPPKCDQGFVDNDYRYLDRNEAWRVALEAAQLQLAAGYTHGSLHSEDVW